MDIASGANRHLDITFRLQLVERSSFVSVLVREAFNHPYISFHMFFLLLVSVYIMWTPYRIGGLYRWEGRN